MNSLINQRGATSKLSLSASDARRAYRLMRRLLVPLERNTNSEERRALHRFVTEAYRAECFASADGDSHTELFIVLEAAVVALTELHLDVHSAVALMLFRPVTEEVMSVREVENELGTEPVRLIRLLSGVSALYQRKESISSTNFHNLLLTMAEDIRVILLIISDRLYRLRQAKYLYKTDGERAALAVEISFLYSPIAHRLGLYTIKGEMEDLCLKWRDRTTFDFIKRKLGETKASRDAYIESFLSPLRLELNKQLDIAYEMKGRVKSISSIHNKLRKQSFDDIYDLFAIRIILDVPLQIERQACWQVYSIVTDLYMPNPERLKDWISIPKSNGYESLHITVMGPENRWVEVQIRTCRMDAIAEQGVAAHWRYKGIRSEGGGLDAFLASVRETLEAVKEEGESDERILESSMMTLKAEEIYVFTPKGEVLKLPRGATVLDFAFAIHSKVGCSAVSGKVNGKNVSIKHQLQNGDAVEIITNSQQSPKQDWLSFVVSQRAKNRIRQVLRIEEEVGIDFAKEAFRRRLRNRKLAYNEALFTRLVQRRGYKTLSDFFKDVTLGQLDLKSFLDSYESELRAVEQAAKELGASSIPISADMFTSASDVIGQSVRNTQGGDDVLVIDKGLSGVEYSFAQCCMPVYGDQVFGFVSARGIKIHRVDCPNAPDMISRTTGHRVLSARWSGVGEHFSSYSLEVVGKDDISVVTHIISLIKKDDRVQLRNYSLDSSDGLFRGTFTLSVNGAEGIGYLIKKIRGAVGVKKVERL